MLWRKLIYGKFGGEPRGWCSQERREDHGVGLWMSIRKVCGTFKAKKRLRWAMEKESNFGMTCGVMICL